MEDKQLKAGEMVEVAFRADKSKEIYSYQFAQDFDAAALTFADVRNGELANMNAANFGLPLLNEGVIPLH